MVGAPKADGVALAPGTLQRAIFPAQRMDIGLALFGIEELVEIGEHRHGGESPGSYKIGSERMRRFSPIYPFLPSYKLREIERGGYARRLEG